MSPERERGPERPPAQAFWSGTISFGLVSIPVQLLAGQRARPTSLRAVAPDGTPLRREYYCPEDGTALEPDQLVRGHQVEDGEFVVVSEEELEGLEPERSRDIDLRRFVPAAELDPAAFDRAYWLAPEGSSSKAYRLLAEVLEQRGQAGIATFVLRGREHLVALLAERGVLRAQVLRFADELRPPDQAGLPVEGRADPALVRRLRRALHALRADALPAEALADEAAALLQELVESKRARGEGLIQLDSADEGDARDQEQGSDDIVEVLRRSLRVTKGGRAGRSRRSARSSGAGAGVGGAGGGLEELSKEELYERARAREIPGRSRMSKAQLVRALQESA